MQESMSLFEDAREEGFSGEWLHRSEVLKLEPRLSDKLIGGVRLFGNATLSSLLYTQALAEAAQKNGATVRSGVARGVRLDNGRVLSVILADDGELPATKWCWPPAPGPGRRNNGWTFRCPWTL